MEQLNDRGRLMTLAEIRDKMKLEDWEKWFEELHSEYLIEVPSDYFFEDVGFNDDPEVL